METNNTTVSKEVESFHDILHGVTLRFIIVESKESSSLKVRLNDELFLRIDVI